MAFEFAEKNNRPGSAPGGDELRHHRRWADGRGNGRCDRRDRSRDFGERLPAYRSVEVRVILVDGGDRVLSGFPEDLSASALKQLKSLRVEVRLGVHAENVTEAGVSAGGEFIPSRVKVWAAGNEASFVGKTLGVPVDRAGRVIVHDDLTIPDHPEVQVIGDLANCVWPATGKPLPGVSPVAIQQGRHAALNIVRLVAGGHPKRLPLLGQGEHGHDRPQ